jgi:hypothetical protein
VTAQQRAPKPNQICDKRLYVETMSKRTVYHVTKDAQGWKVAKEHAERASLRTETKAAAVDAARDLAKNATGPSQVKIHKQDGTIQTEHTYGADPTKYPG